MRERPQAHGIQQKPTMAARGARGTRARVAIPTCPAASGNGAAAAATTAAAASVAALQGDLLLLSQDLDFRGSKAKRGVRDGSC